MMACAMKTLLALILFALHMNSAVEEKRIILSKESKSFDNINCGTEHQPCATFLHAISLLCYGGGVLVIDGGTRGSKITPYLFNASEVIKINGSLILQNRLHKDNQSLLPTVSVDRLVNNSVIVVIGNLTITSINFSSLRHLDDKVFFQVHNPNWQLQVTVRNSIFEERIRSIIVFHKNSSYINIEYTTIKSHFSVVNKQSSSLMLNILIKTIRVLNITLNEIFITITDSEAKQGIVGIFGTTKENEELCIRNSTFIHVSFLAEALYILFQHNHFIGQRLDKIIVHDCPLTRIINCTFQSIPLSMENVNKTLISYSVFQNIHRSIGLPALKIGTGNDLKLCHSRFVNNSGFFSVPTAMEINLKRLYMYNVNVSTNYENVVDIRVSFKIGEELPAYISNMTIGCDMGKFFENLVIESEMDYRFKAHCRNCSIGSYSLLTRYHSFGLQSISSSSQNMSKPNPCQKCPFGGICNNGVRSKGGYWGKVTSDVKTMRFTQCPVFYCCQTADKCKSYDTCADNRENRLCSMCRRGFSCSVSGQPRCVSNKKCGKNVVNAFVYILIAIFYLCVIMYLGEIKLFFKRLIKAQNNNTIEVLNDETSVSLNERLLPESFHRGDGSQITVLPYQMLLHTNVTHMEYVPTTSVISGSIKVLFFFYQSVAIMRVETPEKFKITFPALLDTISSVFNVRPDITYVNSGICFMPNLQYLHIKLVKHGFPTLIMFFILTILLLRKALFVTRKCKQNSRSEQWSPSLSREEYTRINANVPFYNSLPFNERLKCAYVQIVLIGFAGISTFTLQCVHCISINQQSYLFIQASIECYQPWQIAIWVFIVLWVIPLPFVLYLSHKLLYECLITPSDFLLILIFPPFLLYKLFVIKIQKKKIIMTTKETMLSKHLLMIVSESFRETQDGSRLCWEAMLMLTRLILVVIHTFIEYPIHKMFPTVSLLMIFVGLHDKIMPFKDAKVNTLEKSSLLVLMSLSFVNMFWAFTNEYELMESNSYRALGKILLYYELFILLLPLVILINALLAYAFKRLFKMFKFCISKQD